MAPGSQGGDSEDEGHTQGLGDPPRLTQESVGQADGLRGHGHLVAHDIRWHQDGLAHVGRHHPRRVPLARRQPRVRHVVGAGGHLPALPWGG